MPHETTHVIITAVGPVFSDPAVRQCLSPQQCAKVDAILQKDHYTRRELRIVLRALEDALFHEDE